MPASPFTQVSPASQPVPLGHASPSFSRAAQVAIDAGGHHSAASQLRSLPQGAPEAPAFARSQLGGCRPVLQTSGSLQR